MGQCERENALLKKALTNVLKYVRLKEVDKKNWKGIIHVGAGWKEIWDQDDKVLKIAEVKPHSTIETDLVVTLFDERTTEEKAETSQQSAKE